MQSSDTRPEARQGPRKGKTHMKVKLLLLPTVAAVIAAPLAFVGSASAAPLPTVQLQWNVTSDWGSGFQVAAVLKNTSTNALNP